MVTAAAVAEPSASLPKYRGVRAAPSQTAAATSIDARELVILVRASLLTLNDAMHSGNFTVLRDLIAPSVQSDNTAGRLYQTFGSLIQQRVDLSSVAVDLPKLTQSPVIGADHRLRVAGNFPTPTGQINFDLTYEKVDARWRLYGLSVNVGPRSESFQSAQRRAPASAPPTSDIGRR